MRLDHLLSKELPKGNTLVGLLLYFSTHVIYILSLSSCGSGHGFFRDYEIGLEHYGLVAQLVRARA